MGLILLWAGHALGMRHLGIHAGSLVENCCSIQGEPDESCQGTLLTLRILVEHRQLKCTFHAMVATA